MISFSSVRSCFGEHPSIIRLTPCFRRRTVWAQLFSNWSHLVTYERSPPHSSIFASIHFLFSPLRLSILFFSLSERRSTVFPSTSFILRRRRRLLLFPFNINTFHIGVCSYVITSIVHLQQQLQRVTRLTSSTVPSFDIFLSEHERVRGTEIRALMDKLGVNTLFLSATSSNPTRRFSLVPPFTKSNSSSSPTNTPTGFRRKSMIEPAAVSDDQSHQVVRECPRLFSFRKHDVISVGRFRFRRENKWNRVLTLDCLSRLPKLDAKQTKSVLPNTRKWNGNAKKSDKIFEKK